MHGPAIFVIMDSIIVFVVFQNINLTEIKLIICLTLDLMNISV